MSFDAWKAGSVAPATVEVPVALLDVKDSPQLRVTLRGHSDGVQSLAFTPDGATVASCTVTGEIKLWDTASAKERRQWESSPSLFHLAITPDGAMLAASWYELIDKDGKTLKRPFKAGDMKGYRGGIKLWNVATGKERGILQRSSARGVIGFAFSPDGKTLAASEIWRENDSKNARGIAFWDVATSKVIRDLNTTAYTMAFSPDGKTLAISTSEGVLLWDVSTGRQRSKLDAEKVSIAALAFAPDGKTLAGSDLQATVHLWDVSSGEVKAQLRHRDGQMVKCLAFAPNGKTLAVGVGPRNVQVIEPGEIELWDPKTKERRLTLRGHTRSVLSLSFNGDGSLLASGGADNTVKLWDIGSRSASKR